jgi:CRISPR-associated endonuclease/helicase Cas3
VIEAGVDLSARRLWSEIAPWPSLIQRLGRLNRDGRLNGDARACFWERPEKPKRSDRLIGPYEAEAVRFGRRLVDALVAACESDDTLSARDVLASLNAREATTELIKKALAPAPEPCPRAVDVHGLFSTEPDVFGGFTDVSPFVRSQDENADVTVFWREWRSEAELRRSEDLVGPAFSRDEGCAVAAGRLRGFLEKRRARTWDDKREAWGSVRAGDIRPGMLVMLRRGDGGYSRELGWTGSRTDKLDDAPPPGEPYERFADDRFSEGGAWVTLTDHLRDAGREAAHVVQALSLDADLGSAVPVRGGCFVPFWRGRISSSGSAASGVMHGVNRWSGHSAPVQSVGICRRSVGGARDCDSTNRRRSSGIRRVERRR